MNIFNFQHHCIRLSPRYGNCISKKKKKRKKKRLFDTEVILFYSLFHAKGFCIPGCFQLCNE